MSPYDNAGRIHKTTFLVSNLVLFVLCLISACARFYIRIHLQKSFSIDDGILLFGIACLICAMGVLFKLADTMFLIGASEAGAPGLIFPPDFIERSFEFEKLAAVVGILTWCSIVSVKFSYLFLFKKLLSRIRPLVIYWWFVAVFNAIISAYGATVYIAACPVFYNINALQCAFGTGLQRDFAFSISQMVLDIIGDLLILYIPCRLIWKIKIKWTQKIALLSTLCLTILTIACTIARISGIHTGRTVSSIDSVWELYWQFIAANVALTMTAATAFRTFFVVRKDGGPQSPSSQNSWFLRGRHFLRSAFSHPFSLFQSRRGRSKLSGSSSGSEGNHNAPMELYHNIPRGTMTGIRTIISGQGRTAAGHSQVMSTMVEEEFEDTWPLSDSRNARGIKVQQDITLGSDDAC